MPIIATTATAGARVRDDRSGAIGTAIRVVGQHVLVRYDNGQEVYRPVRVMSTAA